MFRSRTKALRIAAQQGDRYAGNPQRRPRPLPLCSYSPFSPPPDPAPATAPCTTPPQIGRGVQCSGGPLAEAARPPVQGAGADTAAGRTYWRGGADAAAGWRRGTAASSAPAAAPTPPPPARRQRRRSCGAYLPRGGADAAARRLRGTVASGPSAAPRHRGPFITTCCTG